MEEFTPKEQDIINSMVTAVFMIIISVLALIPETTTFIVLGGDLINSFITTVFLLIVAILAMQEMERRHLFYVGGAVEPTARAPAKSPARARAPAQAPAATPAKPPQPAQGPAKPPQSAPSPGPASRRPSSRTSSGILSGHRSRPRLDLHGGTLADISVCASSLPVIPPLSLHMLSPILAQRRS
ncbi:cyclin-dependent kinase inhibitor 1C-like isoform X2 [Panthera leo]|uniref:cyclin-dependent kinase inhibitor 1C-like isoform X2 n=1 Tax=Panthera leo TaxID=9689 RepID=UPI001C6A5767|nr:cyclin-dependent kinase inhibitor 1C-like isoform X2 [Panthera leo]